MWKMPTRKYSKGLESSNSYNQDVSRRIAGLLPGCIFLLFGIRRKNHAPLAPRSLDNIHEGRVG